MGNRFALNIGDRIPLTLADEYELKCVGSGKAGAYNIVGVSVRGKLHEYNETPRDDAFAARFDGTWLVVAVADGAGSKLSSRYGASFSVNSLCDKLIDSLCNLGCSDVVIPTIPSSSKGRRVSKVMMTNVESTAKPQSVSLKEILSESFSHTRTELEHFASKHDVELDELHCTLLALVLNVKTGKLGMGQIGDGLVLGLNDEKHAVQLVEPPMADEPGASYFLTQLDWERYFLAEEITAKEAKHFTTFYLMTDGVANDCQFGPPEDILNLWANDMDREVRLIPSLEVTAERLKNYLSSYQARGSFDDRTLVVIYRAKLGRTR